MATIKTTAYFKLRRKIPGREFIKDEWIRRVAHSPQHTEIQKDGRTQKWSRINEFDGRWLRVVLLEDGETVHNAFFDRGFRDVKCE